MEKRKNLVYFDSVYNENSRERIFSKKDLRPIDLKWHRDEYDRLVYISSGFRWKLQIDNNIPIDLIVGRFYLIPKMIYHRIIMGEFDLIITIFELS